MTPGDLDRAQAALLGGASLDAVCEGLGVNRRALERAWRKALGTTPDRWRRQVLGLVRRPTQPDVSFRLSPGDRAELARRAELAGVSPSELARALVLEALAQGR